MAERPQSDLGAVLRREAERHVPDGDAMFDRINKRRFAAEPARAPRPFRWFAGLRPVAAAASVAATLVAGFTGIKLLTSDDPRPALASTTSTASVAPSVSVPAPTATGKPEHTTTAPRARPRSSRPSAPPSVQPVSGFLSSSGVADPHSTDTWAQSDVTVTSTREITALDLAISVDRSGGVRNTGSWSTIPASLITITVSEEKDVLIYRFTLRPGGVLAAGDYVFAAQYEHTKGRRDLSADRYGASASAGDRRAQVAGTFAAG